jgi:hypothetical protein
MEKHVQFQVSIKLAITEPVLMLSLNLIRVLAPLGILLLSHWGWL